MVLLLLSFACVLYLACFHPFLDYPHQSHSEKSHLHQVISADIHNIKARIAHNIEIEADQCLFSENTMVFNEVYLTDHLAGSLHAKKITWNVGSDEILCTGLIEGNLHEKKIAVQSPTATYNMKSGELEWGDSTHWSLDPSSSS